MLSGQSLVNWSQTNLLYSCIRQTKNEWFKEFRALFYLPSGHKSEKHHNCTPTSVRRYARIATK